MANLTQERWQNSDLDQKSTTLVEFFESASKNDGYGITLYERSGQSTKRTHQSLWLESLKWAGALGAIIQPGDRVAIVLPTSFEFIVAFFAVKIAGGIPFCLATKKLVRAQNYAETTEAMLHAAAAKLVISDEKFVGTLSSVVGRAMKLITCEELESDGCTPQSINYGVPDSIAMLQFSSGTTRNPAPIILTERNVITNVRDILCSFADRIDRRYHSGCSWLPLHHDMGLIGNLFTAILGGGDLALMRPEDFVLRPALWLKALSETKATVTPCPGFALQMCIDRVELSELQGVSLASLNLALIGAEKVDYKILRSFADKFEPVGFRFSAFTPVYGLAEATLAVTFSEAEKDPVPVRMRVGQVGERVKRDDSAPARVSVGKPLPHVSLEIRDRNGKVLTDEQLGIIYVSGDAVSPGYFITGEKPQPQAWLNTGDLGFIYQRELYIYGREKDIIIVNGRNHDPEVIEEAAATVAGVLRAAAFAVGDGDGELESFALAAEIDPKLTEGDVEKQIRQVVTRETGLVPKKVILVKRGAIPRTTSGKIRRAEARRVCLNNEIDLAEVASV